MADGSLIKKLHHVAIAVESIDASAWFYRNVLGLGDIKTMTLEDRGLKVALIRAGESEIELLEPIADDNTVKRFLERRGPGLHHICFEVDDVEAAMRQLKGRGVEFIDDVPREGAVGLVAFMPPAVADNVLVELAQVTGVGPQVSEEMGASPPTPQPTPEAR